MIDLTGFAPRDAKLIKDNEGKSIYDLLQLGLSPKAGDRLAELNYDESQYSNKPVTIEVNENAPIVDKQHSMPYVPPAEQSNIVKPSSVKKVDSKTQLTMPKEYARQKVAGLTGSVRVHNKRTGKTNTMSASAAKRLMKNPHLYSIVQ
jgi:hypothetical protein